jgi:hypothetical protein
MVSSTPSIAQRAPEQPFCVRGFFTKVGKRGDVSDDGQAFACGQNRRKKTLTLPSPAKAGEG